MERQLILPVEKKYSQEWSKYNLAKTNEKRLFIEMLHDLSKLITEPEYKFGRPPVPIKDLFFCAGLKLYSNYSGRKAVSDYKLSLKSGYIRHAPHFNTLKDFFNCDATYDLLQRLLVISALPLKEIENHYSLDASGFGSYSTERWNKAKWKKKVPYKNYMKGHILIGTKTNIICECEITPGNFADVRQAPKIITNASKNFKIGEFSADRAYSSKLVFRILQSIGSIPYVPFKSNVTKPTEGSPEIWNEMFLQFKNNKEEWEKHYHKRSNVECTFAMVKRRFGEILLSKNYKAQRSELMMKLICHNICCLIQEIYERGIKVEFDQSALIHIEREVPKELDTRPASKVENCDY